MKSLTLIFFIAIAFGGSLVWAKAVVRNFEIAECCSQNQICNEEIPLCLEYQIRPPPISLRTDAVGESAARNATIIPEEEENESEDGEEEREGEPEDEEEQEEEQDEEQEEESDVAEVESPSDGESDDCGNDIGGGSENGSESEADDVKENN